MRYLILLFQTLFLIAIISMHGTALADCISLRAAARRVIAFVKYDPEVPDCLAKVTPEQWKQKMKVALKSMTGVYEGEGADEQLTGFTVVICQSPYNSPDTTEENWKYGYQTYLNISCTGHIDKQVESND